MMENGVGSDWTGFKYIFLLFVADSVSVVFSGFCAALCVLYSTLQVWSAFQRFARPQL